LSPLTVSSLSRGELGHRLGGSGVVFRTGLFTVRLGSRLPAIADGVELLYADYPLADDAEFIDFEIGVDAPSWLRRWLRPKIVFTFDGYEPFLPTPSNQAIVVFEWGFNWSIATTAHHYLVIHSGAVELNGRAAILPALPGSGKSTLCAAMVHRGWRLLSDEMALVSMADGRIDPLARPVSLKNESIEVIRRFAPEAVISPPTPDTAKGTVALMKAPTASVVRKREPATPAWIIFPKFQRDAPARLEPRSKADTFLEIGENAFNYSVHGRRGFETLGDMIDACDCFDLAYGDLDEAIGILSALATGG